MLVERSMHPDWLSNAYVLANEGGPAVFVDSGADLAPLVDAVERWGATPVAILRTHAHHDHVENEDELAGRYSVPVISEPGEWKWDGLDVRGLATPGHSDDGLSFVVNEETVATGDTLFRDAVGGGDVSAVRRSVMEVLLELPDTTRVLPGHTDETTIGRERRENPFVRVWSGGEEEGSERVRVGGRDATLLVWSPDYDGNGKAWVRFDDGDEAIVGGSRVERG
ncbi:MAG TPA: MBL fold metallo-hydrolase [Gaiellaceae bacterium]|nr:MBL fold metallo-hydrolase [Gaiellaceae bacterium]